MKTKIPGDPNAVLIRARMSGHLQRVKWWLAAPTAIAVEPECAVYGRQMAPGTTVGKRGRRAETHLLNSSRAPNLKMFEPVRLNVRTA